jgi:hypothetical protein
MSEFWKTPEGKILSYGIHEHSSGLGYINNAVSFINTLIEKDNVKLEFKDEETKEWFFKCLQNIKDGKVKARDSVDYIYTEIKKLKEDD